MMYLLAAVGLVGGVKIPAATMFQDPVQFLEDHAAAYLSGLAVMVIGLFLARWIGKMVARTLEKQPLEPPVRLLMVRLARLLVLALTLVIALGAAGFEMTALIRVWAWSASASGWACRAC